ncbi:IclR family transcriptional regulator [Aquibacillus saliphilus]|uniref:IclR family transcriptional regulator n=1 Tax=Aquibacillus saliphilus TaxID=1909422 RepID=UPI001CF0A4D4|nr:IclR family transcriptional regulator [Aquibacillus saliphilus]
MKSGSDSSVNRAIKIIRLLSQFHHLTVTEISRRLEIPKTTCFVILQTLEFEGIIRRDNQAKYNIDKGLYALILNADNYDLLKKIARPILQDLTNKTQMTSHLAVREGMETVYLDKVDDSGYVKFNTYKGQTHPLYITSVGKAILMNMDNKEIIKSYAETTFLSKHENTVTSLEDLLDQLEGFRNKGYTLEDEEGEIGIRCIGAPVVDSTGQTIAALSITTLKEKLPESEYFHIGSIIQEAAKQLAYSIELERT